MTATLQRRRLARSELRVVPPVGTTAAFVAHLAAKEQAEAAPRGRLRGLLPRLRPQGRPSTWGWRAPMVLLLLVGVLLAGFLLNIGGDSGSHVKQVGGTATASAGCPIMPIPDSIDFSIPFITHVHWDFTSFKRNLNNFCDAVGNFASNLWDAVTGAIKDGIWAAFNENHFCWWRTSLSPDNPNHGLGALMQGGVNFIFGTDQSKATAQTTWNMYGTAGADWDTYFLDCFDTNQLVNFGANFVFDIAKLFAVIAVLLFQQTFDNQVIDIFFSPQQGSSQSIVDQMMQDLNLKLYTELFAVAVVLGAIVLLVRTVMSKGQGLADVFGKVGTMAAVVAFATFFLHEGSGLIRQANSYTNQIGATVLTALTGTSCQNSDGKSVNAEPYDCSAQIMYDALIFRPWASGEIGDLEVLNNPGETQARRQLAMRILTQQAYSRAEADKLDDPKTSEADRKGLLDAKQKDRTAMVKEWGARFIVKNHQPAADFDPNSWRPFDHVQADRTDYWQMWSGSQSGQRMVVAVTSLLASFMFGLVTIAITASYLVLQLVTVVLAVLAPLIFLVGIIPVYGFRVLLRWGEIFMQTFIKRVALVVFIGVLLALLHLVYTLALPWWLQLVLIVCMAVAALSYRKSFSSWASSGVPGMAAAGGAAGIATGGVSGILDARRSLKQSRQGWKSSRGLPLSERFKVAGASGRAGLERAGGNDVEGPPAPRPKSSRRSAPSQPAGPAGARPRNAPMSSRPGYSYSSNTLGTSYVPPAPTAPTSGRRNSGYVYQRGGAPGGAPSPTQDRTGAAG